MNPKYTLITAVLMSLAALAWGFTLTLALRAEAFPTLNVVVFLMFASLAILYWALYFRNKSTTTSGTE